MKLPEYAPSTSDRISTREELFEVLELLGGFEEPQGTESTPKCDLFSCLEPDPTTSPAEILDALTSSEERLLTEIEPFKNRKAERIN
jgi:hypothetical protein